jgi:hypothetical protein
MQKFALCKNLLRLLPVRPAPTARAGPEGPHSQPVLHNAPSIGRIRGRRTGPPGCWPDPCAGPAAMAHFETARSGWPYGGANSRRLAFPGGLRDVCPVSCSGPVPAGGAHLPIDGVGHFMMVQRPTDINKRILGSWPHSPATASRRRRSSGTSSRTQASRPASGHRPGRSLLGGAGSGERTECPVAHQAETRSQTKMRVSPGAIIFPAPRSP